MTTDEQQKPWKLYASRLHERDLAYYDALSRGVDVIVFPPLFPSTDKEKISSFCAVARVSAYALIRGLPVPDFCGTRL
jgi:hypothetical protein